MKSLAYVAGRKVLPAWRQLAWAGVLSVMIGSTAGLAQGAGGGLPTIRGGLLFERPVEAVGESPAAAQEASLLSAALSSANRSNRVAVAEALEAFAAENPSSVWTPSLRANLGRRYCREGQWTKALESWERAWDATRQYQRGAGKRVGDYTLAFWTRLLVELGRLDELQVIFAEAEGRTLDRGPLSQKYVRTKEGYAILRHRPEAAYRCGWLVLNQLARATRGQGLDPRKVRELYAERNLLQSCSLSALVQIALDAQWSMIGVERPEGGLDLPIPSVMHLKQGHYVALLRANGGLVLAYDPIFGVRYFRREVLNAETSGRFLVDAGWIPAGWRTLSAEEMAATVGRSGHVFGFLDGEEGDCDDCGCPGTPGGGGKGGKGGKGFFGENHRPTPGDGAGGSGSSCAGCGGAGGMPQWRVTEPNINLWLRDQPISCQPAYGPAVALDLQFKQRDELWSASDTFSFGPSWNSHWLSYVDYDSDEGFSVQARAAVHLPGGGVVELFFEGGETVVTNYTYNCRLTATLDNGEPIAFTLVFPDGRECVYDRVWETSPLRFYMSRSADQQGFVTRYNYVEVESGTMLHLDTVADQAGETLFTLQYTNGTVCSNLVSVVTDRFGRSARMFYTEDQEGNALLSRIEDAAGLASTVSYDTNGWPQTLATPYGSTTFEYDAEQSFNTYHRRVRITEPNGGSQTYLFSSFCANLWSGGPWMPFELPASLVPDNLPEGTTIDPYMQPVNSFYWNQAQNSGVPTDLSQLTTNHLNKARLRHWLMRNPGGEWYPPDFAVSWEAAPSQSEDGSTMGQITFYDYAGKDPNSPWLKGTQIQPSLIARKLPDGSTWYTAYERNSYGLGTTETSTYGTGNPASTRTHTYSYAGNGQDLVERRGPGNVLLATYAYNSRHQMTNEVLWPDSVTGYTNTWSYDELGRLESKTTAAGQTTTFSYNGSSGAYSGYLSATSEAPVERSESFTWLNGMVRAHTDARGLTVTNFWDGLNRLTGRLYPDGTATTNLYSRATAYPNGTGGLDILDLTATKDRLGHWTYFDYDALRRMTAKTNANGVVSRYGYCECGPSASHITNAWGSPVEQVTVFTFDNQGNRVMDSYADGYSVTNWFNALGQRIVTGDGTGYRWLFYNNQGLLTTVSNVFGAESVVTFDVHDRPEYATDANGVTVANAYDSLGRLLGRGYPDNGVEWFGYSARGLVAYTNQLGLVTRYAYDAAGRKTYETNANTEVLRYTNSAAGDLLSLTDGKNQTTRWSYDEQGRVTNKLDQAGAEILRYRYDAESRLTNRWSAAKGNTGYAYDPVGNLTNVNYPSSADVRFQYDWLNRVTNMVDAVGTTKYAYTAGNQVWTEDGPFASDTVTNIYSNRQRVALRLQQPTGLWTNGFGWDLAGRLTSVTSPAGAFGYGYTTLDVNCSGRLVQQVGLPNGAYITNFYDPVARVLGTLLKSSGGSTLDAALYGYNEGNQRTAWTNASGAFVQYTYDPISQLKVANSVTNAEDRGYAYDAAWNLNWRTNAGTTTWAYYVDGKNQLTNGTMVGPASYDLNGNLTNRSGWPPMTYQYDDENRLVTVQCVTNEGGSGFKGPVAPLAPEPAAGPGWRTRFVYDGLGRLRRRLEEISVPGDKAGGGGGYEWYFDHGVSYVYDGWRVIQERDEGDNPTVSYTRGSDLSGSMEGAGGIGGLLARSSGYSGGNWTSHACYHADGNGNATCLINASQSVVASYRYDPFGNTVSKTGTLADANVYRFSSKEVHVQSGMYYYGYRFYDPNLQRWMNRDPLSDMASRTSESQRFAFVYGAPSEAWAGANTYAFMRNNSIVHIDADGRFAAGIPGFPIPIVFPIAYPLLPGARCGWRIKNEVWRDFGEHRGQNDPSARLAHCIAHCRITRECPGGALTSWVGGLAKEIDDELKQRNGSGGAGAEPGDMAANAFGRKFARCKQKSCEEQCQGALDDGLFYPPAPGPAVE